MWRWTARLRFDYTTVGHVTVDVLADGSRRAGGAAFYSALQAARLGLRARSSRAACAGEIEAAARALRRRARAARARPAPQTTTLLTARRRRRAHAARCSRGPDRSSRGPARRQRDPAPRAGRARDPRALERRAASFVGLTPQGLVARWPGERAPDRAHCAADPISERLADRCDAIVAQRARARQLRRRCIARARGAGAIVAVTDGHAPEHTARCASGEQLALDVPAIDAAMRRPRRGRRVRGGLLHRARRGRAPVRGVALRERRRRRAHAGARAPARSAIARRSTRDCGRSAAHPDARTRRPDAKRALAAGPQPPSAASISFDSSCASSARPRRTRAPRAAGCRRRAPSRPSRPSRVARTRGPPA